MSQAPYAVRNSRWGSPLGVDLKVMLIHVNHYVLEFNFCKFAGYTIQMEDTLWSSLTDAHCKLPMALTAEKLADQYGITREDCDRFALASQQRWANGLCPIVVLDLLQVYQSVMVIMSNIVQFFYLWQ